MCDGHSNTGAISVCTHLIHRSIPHVYPQAVCSVLGNVSEADGRRAVAGALAAELAGLPTTPAQDEQLLEDGRRMQDDRLRNAVLFRIQKKAVLEAAQQCLV